MHQVASICTRIPDLYKLYKDWISDQEARIESSINKLDATVAYMFYEKLSREWDSKYLSNLIPKDLTGDLGVILEVK